MIKLFVKDRCGGYVHEIGTNSHDSLVLENGCLYYYNLQNGEGSLSDYEFVNEDGSAIEDEYLRYAWIGIGEPTELEKQVLEKALDKVVWCIKNNIDFLANTEKTEDELKEWFKEDWY